MHMFLAMWQAAQSTVTWRLKRKLLKKIGERLKTQTAFTYQRGVKQQISRAFLYPTHGFSRTCLWDIQEFSRTCLEDVQKFSKTCHDLQEFSRTRLEDIREFSRTCLEDVREFSRTCLEYVREFSRTCLEDVREFSMPLFIQTCRPHFFVGNYNGYYIILYYIISQRVYSDHATGWATEESRLDCWQGQEIPLYFIQ